MTIVRVVTCAGGATWEAALVRGLQRRELGIEVVRRCVDLGELVGISLADRPRAAVVAAELPWLDREVVGTLHDHGVAVVAVEHHGSTRALDRIGVAHRIAAASSPEEVAGLLHSLVAPVGSDPPALESGSGGGRVIAVWGPAGAPGRTTVAVHLSIELADAGDSTILIDGDTWAGTVAQMLCLEESPSVARAARVATEGWSEPLDRCLQLGPSGVRVLPGLARADLWPELRERSWTALVDEARANAEHVVIDVAAPIEEDEELAFDRVPYRRNLVTLRTLELADEIVVVTRGDPVSLRRAILAMRELSERRPRLSARTHVVLNAMPRSPRRLQECSRAVEEWIGEAPAALLPVESAFERTVWEGRALQDVAPRSQWLRELRSFVGAWSR